jgi:peptide/nickel transport system permease protein
VTTYIIRRLLQALIILITVTFLVFVAMRLLPGDPILMIISQQQKAEITPEYLAQIRHENGLDKSIMVQYFDWMGGIFRGDFGKSILRNEPVTKEIVRRIPISLYLGMLAFIFSLVIGIPLGVICTVRRGTWYDTTITVLANTGITIPNFWLGFLLIYLFALLLKWLPVQGFTSPFENFSLSTRQLIMPVICDALFPIASNVRQTRSAMLEVMGQDYIRTAWSKGLKERLVITRHALKNGLMPVITLAGMGLGGLVGGSVLIETVFNIPGLGRLAVQAVLNKDYPYVQAVTLLVAVAIVMANLLVDIAYGWLDPRIRYG